MDKVLAITMFTDEGDCHVKKFDSREDAFEWVKHYTNELVASSDKEVIYFDDSIGEGAAYYNSTRYECEKLDMGGSIIHAIDLQTEMIEYNVLTAIIDPNEIK
jgi:hypothetical protein